MLYMQGTNGTKVIVLETENLEEIRKGHPAHTPDDSVVIAWTPDPEWLAARILASDGDAVAIGKAIDEAAKRPQAPLRPRHETNVHKLGGSSS